MGRYRVQSNGDIWVFGYGSLMWNPGFPYVDARPAHLLGYHRAFCLYSEHYRGTPEHRGLVLGLDSGGGLVLGGKRPEHLQKGYYYGPTVFDNIDNASAIAQEEIFGPVCVV